MRQLIYLTSALDDLTAILGYITRESLDRTIGMAFVTKLRHQCEKLASLPGTLGTDRSDLVPGIRSMPCRGYVIFFRYTGATLEIVNILSAQKDIDSYFSSM